MNRRFAFVAALLLSFVPLGQGEELVLLGRPVKRQISGNLTLQGAVEIALKQNPEIKRTRGVVIRARSDALPHLSVNATYDQQSKSLLENVGSGGFAKSSGGV